MSFNPSEIRVCNDVRPTRETRLQLTVPQTKNSISAFRAISNDSAATETERAPSLTRKKKLCEQPFLNYDEVSIDAKVSPTTIRASFRKFEELAENRPT